jgi:membrane-associated phospholipid phosphatase
MPRKLIHEHRFFLGVFAIYIVVGAFGFLIYKQGAETLFFDRHHSLVRDRLFIFTTHLAEGLTLTLIGVVLFFARLKYFFLYLIDLAVVSIVITVLKVNFFPERVRPALFFSGQYKLHFAAGIPVLTVYSFPSGHTAVAFAVAFLLAIFIKRTWVSMVLLCIALLVGLSRMYLMEHFWIDVYFGSLTGILITLLVYLALQKPMIHSSSKLLDLSLYERYLKKKVK